MTDEPVTATAAERLIEVTIGLWPDDDPPGKRPPRLAAAIVKALRDEGFTITQPSEPATAACAGCGMTIAKCGESPGLCCDVCDHGNPPASWRRPRGRDGSGIPILEVGDEWTR